MNGIRIPFRDDVPLLGFLHVCVTDEQFEVVKDPLGFHNGPSWIGSSVLEEGNN